MKFIIDENISPAVVEIFRDHSLTAYHVNELKKHAKHRIIDDQLRRLAIQKAHIIITKDDDFVKSYVNRKVPEKMVFLHGLDTKDLLISRFKELVPQLEVLIKKYDFIEVNQQEIKFPFS